MPKQWLSIGVHSFRKLVLMRHADSEDSRNGRDFDRNITAAGQLAARQVPEPAQLGALV